METEEYVQPTIFQEILGKKTYILKSSLVALAFWLAQFLYQFYLLTPGDVKYSLIRSFGITGATLISLALILGPLAKLTRYNYLIHRRAVGVWGFTFVIMHTFVILAYVLNWNPLLIFSTLNPWANPVIFGSIAFVLFLPLYATSTNWAVRKLGYPRWKNLHRLIYFAYLASVLHYTQVNPLALENLPGYLLRIITVLAIGMQIAGFIKVSMQTKNKKHIVIGSLIILSALAMLAYAFFRTWIV